MNMSSMIFISPDENEMIPAINKFLETEKLRIDHQDILFFDNEVKLGVEQVKKIREFLSIKPYGSGKKGVILQNANNLTDAAQNAMLKTLEEHPSNVFLILGVGKEDDLMDTVRSRCQIVNLAGGERREAGGGFEDIERLISSSIEGRFEYIEKLDDRDKFLEELVNYWGEEIGNQPKSYEFVKDLLLALEWKNQNVNVRAILEYLMLYMPGKESVP